MHPGLVSIMMPAYNAGAYITEAIESMLAQTYPHWELLVVNDGSTDATHDIAARFSDPRIRLIDKTNGGESSARNVALKHSRGEFLAFLDADDAYLPEHLALTVGFLSAHPNRDAVYTDGFHMDEEGRRLASLQSRRRGPFEGRVYEETVRSSDVFGPPVCVVLRRELVERHALRYDERIVIGPDWDFFVHYAALAAFGYIGKPTCLYRVHQSNITALVDLGRRAGYVTLCRENAIRMPDFETCSVETRVAVFYDLLVNLLSKQVDRQHAVFAWKQFSELPDHEQARLLRLAAADAIVSGNDERIDDWLHRALALNRSDRKTALLVALRRLSPAACQVLLRARASVRGSNRQVAPMADLKPVAVHLPRPADRAATI